MILLRHIKNTKIIPPDCVKWKTSLDKKGYGGAIILDWPKAFDTKNCE